MSRGRCLWITQLLIPSTDPAVIFPYKVFYWKHYMHVSCRAYAHIHGRNLILKILTCCSRVTKYSELKRSTLLAFRPFNQISWSSFSAWSWLRCHRLTYGSNTHVKISGDIQYILCSRMDLVLDVNGLCDLSLKALKASECTFELS